LAAASEEQKKQRLELIEEGTEFVMAKYRFLTIEESNDILFYDSNRGVYVSGGHIVIDKEIDKKYGYKLKTNDINEIKKYVQRKTYVKKEILILIFISQTLQMDYTIGGLMNSCHIHQITIH
jgi:hypothetical protein